MFHGTYGASARNILGIIKAEIHSGYEKEEDPSTKELSLKFVEELLLTPSSRLYKTAAFLETSDTKSQVDDLNAKWIAMVSDYQINQSEGKAAAQYFYTDFLGLGYPQTSARSTKEFYECTSTFIENLDLAAEEKSDLFNALTAYLKADRSTTVDPAHFSETYFDVDTRDAYAAFLEEEGVPNAAFTKDLQHITAKLRFRKISFSRQIEIKAPSETFSELVTIETIAGTPDETGTASEWTKVIVKDRIASQE